MDEDVAILFVGLGLLAAAVTLIVSSMNNRRRYKEMKHQERLAMIQHGVMPSPEVDPAAFETAAGFPAQPRSRVKGERYRTAGVSMIGLGFGLMVLIGGAAREVEIGLGVGGAWVMLGAALVANYLLMRSEREPQAPQWIPPQRPRQQAPPSNEAP